MTNVITALNLVQIVIFILVILLAFIYLIPIILIRRFHNVNNVFTVNLCSCIYWLSFYSLLEFNSQILFGNTVCIPLNYFEMMCTF
jgi:hypothetical protein